MNLDERIKLKEEVVRVYEQWISQTEDLILKQFFIEEKMKAEQRVNEFWLRKVLLSNPSFMMLIGSMVTNRVLLAAPMSSPTEDNAKFEVTSELSRLFSEEGLRLFDGEYILLIVRKSFYNISERDLAAIMNNNEAYITSKAFKVSNGNVQWA